AARALELAEVVGVLAEHPVDLVRGEAERALVVAETVDERRGPGFLELLEVQPERRGGLEEVFLFADALLAQTKGIVSRALQEGAELGQRRFDPGHERVPRLGEREAGEGAGDDLPARAPGAAVPAGADLLPQQRLRGATRILPVGRVAGEGVQ